MSANTANTNNLLKLTSANSKINGSTLKFQSFQPPGLHLDNLTTNTWDANGKTIANNGGAVNPLHGEWSLTRLVDNAGDLFNWFNDCNQKGPVDDVKDNLTITVLASDGTTVLATWTMNGTTPVAYQMAAIDANSNSALYESATFYSTDIQLKLG